MTRGTVNCVTAGHCNSMIWDINYKYKQLKGANYKGINSNWCIHTQIGGI